MPTLNRYADDNEKDGFYIRSNIGGEAPITLQVTPIASQIFRAVGYEDGDTIPTKLVWTMYDLDMVYTLSSLDLDSTPTNIAPGAVLEELGLESKLTEEERAKLISYLEGYTGPDADRVNELRKQLLENTSKDVLEPMSSGESEWFPGFGGLPETLDEVKALLNKWTDSSLTEKAEKALILNEDFVMWSVRTFAAHPLLSETPLIAIGNNELVYELEPAGIADNVTIADNRGNDETVSGEITRSSQYDYRIQRTLFDGSREEAYVRGDTIVRYDSLSGNRGSRLMLSYDLDEILPPHRTFFGGSDDKACDASWLEEEFLSLPINELQSRMKKWGAPTQDAYKNHNEENPEKTESVSQKVIEEIIGIPWVRVLTVDDMSNNNNAKVYLDGNLAVITADIDVDEGDRIVVREPEQEIQDNIQIDRAIPVDNVPSEDTKEWVQSQF